MAAAALGLSGEGPCCGGLWLCGFICMELAPRLGTDTAAARGRHHPHITHMLCWGLDPGFSFSTNKRVSFCPPAALPQVTQLLGRPLHRLPGPLNYLEALEAGWGMSITRPPEPRGPKGHLAFVAARLGGCAGWVAMSGWRGEWLRSAQAGWDG